jgi:hypothetical protein
VQSPKIKETVPTEGSQEGDGIIAENPGLNDGTPEAELLKEYLKNS